MTVPLLPGCVDRCVDAPEGIVIGIRHAPGCTALAGWAWPIPPEHTGPCACGRRPSRRLRRVEPGRAALVVICSVPGCARPVRVKSRGWCVMHYNRWVRHGDPLAGGRGGPQHGTRSRYRKGCRDECCKRAEREYRARYRAARAAS